MDENIPQQARLANDRHGARQPERFNPERAALLDDPACFAYLPPAEVARLLDVPAGGRLVDFGAGTGTYAIELARACPHVEVIALDEQPEMLNLLQAKPAAASLANLKPLLATETPSLQGSVDRVLALNVLHELGNEVLRSLRTLLKPEGAALFIDWNADVDRPAGPPRDHVYSPAEGRTRLESLGFQVQSIKPFNYYYALCAR